MPYPTLLRLLCLCCLWLPLSTAAQRDSTQLSPKQIAKEVRQCNTQRFGVSQFGLLYGRVYDERMARRSYDGIGAQLRFGVEQMRPKERETMLGEVRGFFLEGSNGVTVWSGHADLTYTYQRRILADRYPAWRCYLGGSAGGFIAGRWNEFLSNSSIHVEWMGSLAISGRAETTVTLPLLKRCTLGGNLMLPLVSYVGRLPSYALPGFEDPSHAVALIGDLTRIRSSLDLTRPLGQGNQNCIRIRYFWDFYAYRDNPIHRLRHAVHGLAVTLLFRQGRVYGESSK